MDKFQSGDQSSIAPGSDHRVIVPSDATDFVDIPKAVWVGTGGDVAMLGARSATNADPIVWRNVPSGTLLSFRARRVMVTGTTAADLVAVY